MSATVKNGIGGSDIAAIAGLSQYKTAFDVYARIVENVEEVDDEASATRKEAGHLMEPWLMGRFARKAGIPWASIQRNVELRDEQRPYLRGEADGLTDNLVIEAKTVWSWRQFERWGPDGTDEIPDEYLAQVAWYCWLANKPRAVIVALIDCEVRTFTYNVVPEYAAKLVALADNFWNEHIVKRAPPTAYGAANESMRAVYPRDNGVVRPASENEAKLLENWLLCRSKHSAAADEREHFEAQLKQAINLDAGLKSPIGTLTWKAARDSVQTDWEALAREMGATADQIAKHSATKQGARRLYFSQPKGTKS